METMHGKACRLFADLAVISDAFPNDTVTMRKVAKEIRRTLGSRASLSLGLHEAATLGSTLDAGRAALARQGLYLRRSPSSLRRDMEWVFVTSSPVRGLERRPRRYL